MPRNITITFEDGSTHVYQNAPDTVTPEQVTQRAQQEFGKTIKALDGGRAAAPAASGGDSAEPFAAKLGRQVLNAGAGAIRGAGSIGATLLAPIDAGARALGIQNEFIGRTDRREAMTEALGGLGADTNSVAFQAGKLGGEIAGTAGAGGAVANLLGRAPVVATKAPELLNAIRSAGMTGGSLATRTAGGAVSGLTSAALVNPDDALTGAATGAALPGALKAVGKATHAAGAAIRGGGVKPEVADLANRAKELGIDIPADRLVNSKPLDAVASGLNYVPFSGRAATEAKMGEQLNRAASRLMGQDTPNINLAIRQAGKDLGAKFDETLKSTGVAFDKQLLDDVSEVYNTAERELGSDALKPIKSQVDELIAKGQSGVIDGQAAYNIKRTLDRIGHGNTPTAYHALELKGKLMDALNRSLGDEGAKAFAQTRQQYGNMLALEKLAKNGVDGEISVARLANLKNINNDPLQELADIAAQFVKPREGQHGAMQRAVVGLGGASVAGLPGLAAGAAAGRGANMLLNSNALRNVMLDQPQNLLIPEAAKEVGFRAAPLLAGGR
jgi:hypothetical protein